MISSSQPASAASVSAWHNVPADLVTHIFVRLDDPCSKARMAQVTSSWRRAVVQAPVWRDAVVQPPPDAALGTPAACRQIFYTRNRWQEHAPLGTRLKQIACQLNHARDKTRRATPADNPLFDWCVMPSLLAFGAMDIGAAAMVFTAVAPVPLALQTLGNVACGSFSDALVLGSLTAARATAPFEIAAYACLMNAGCLAATVTVATLPLTVSIGMTQWLHQHRQKRTQTNLMAHAEALMVQLQADTAEGIADFAKLRRALDTSDAILCRLNNA